MPYKTPTHLGTWIVACTPQGDLIKWGKNGDVLFPYPPKSPQIRKQLAYLNRSFVHNHDRLYVLLVFSNGQIKTLEGRS